MKTKSYRYLYITGIVLLIAGLFDPMEGSVVIAVGSGLLTLATFLRHDPKRNVFALAFGMIAMGVAYLFWISSLGGFGGDSPRSWWWGLPILAYPIGWLIDVIILVGRAFKKSARGGTASPA